MTKYNHGGYGEKKLKVLKSLPTCAKHLKPNLFYPSDLWNQIRDHYYSEIQVLIYNILSEKLCYKDIQYTSSNVKRSALDSLCHYIVLLSAAFRRKKKDPFTQLYCNPFKRIYKRKHRLNTYQVTLILSSMTVYSHIHA